MSCALKKIHEDIRKQREIVNKAFDNARKEKEKEEKLWEQKAKLIDSLRFLRNRRKKLSEQEE